MAGPVRFSGLGLHSGRPVTVVIHPHDSGIVFRHEDSLVRAAPEAVSGTHRCTRLGAVSTVEHLMSAFAGLEITDATVELSYPELPALDGSAAEFAVALLAAGLEVVGPHDFSGLARPVTGDRIEVRPGSGRWSYTFTRGSASQTFECRLPGDYLAEVAPARTIAFTEELPRAHELGRGLSLESVVLLGPDGYDNEPRFPDEPARHKLLDLAGDLYLTGIPLRCLDVTARWSGHTDAVRAASLVSASCG